MSAAFNSFLSVFILCRPAQPIGYIFRLRKTDRAPSQNPEHSHSGLFIPKSLMPSMPLTPARMTELSVRLAFSASRDTVPRRSQPYNLFRRPIPLDDILNPPH